MNDEKVKWSSLLFFYFVLDFKVRFPFKHDFIVSKKWWPRIHMCNMAFMFMLDEDGLWRLQCLLCLDVLKNGHMEDIWSKEFLSCENLKETTEATDIMAMWNKFFYSNSLSRNLVKALATMGKNSGFIALIKKLNPNVISCHCILHRHALA